MTILMLPLAILVAPGATAIGSLAGFVVCFFAGRAGWRSIVTPPAQQLPIPATGTKAGMSREVLVACVGGLGFACAIAYAVSIKFLGVAHSSTGLRFSEGLNTAGLILMIVAWIGVALLLARPRFEQSPGMGATLPLFTLTALGVGAGALAWMQVFLMWASGWSFWHGTIFSLVYFVLALLQLIAHAPKFARLRALAMLAAGLATFALPFACAKWPPTDIGTVNGAPTAFVSSNPQPGLALAAAIALLTAIVGAVELRRDLPTA